MQSRTSMTMWSRIGATEAASGPRTAGRPCDSRRRADSPRRHGINFEFYRINFQFAAEINLSSIASPLDKMVHEEEIQMKVLTRLFEDESGVTSIEYAVIAALIAVAAVGSLALIGTDISSTFST